MFFARYASGCASKAQPAPSMATALGGARCASTHLASSASPMDCPEASSFALARTMRANGAPVVRRGCEGKAAGWRAGSAPVRCMFMDEHSTNPVAASRSRKAGAGMDAGGRATQEQLPDAWRPRHRGVLSFGYLSLHKQRKVTRSAEGRAKALLRKSISGGRPKALPRPEPIHR